MDLIPPAIILDVTNDESSSIIAVDVEQFMVTDNISTHPGIIMKRPQPMWGQGISKLICALTTH